MFFFISKTVYLILFRLIFITACIQLIACNNSNHSTESILQKNTVKDTVVIGIKQNFIAITQLPFGFKPANLKDVYTYKPFNDTTGEQTLNNLPLIKATKYFVSDNENPIGLCYETLKNENIKLKKYKYRLPDYKGFQIYYMSGNSKSPNTLKEEFSIDCHTDYSNLIVYDTKSQTASVLTIYYSFYIDSAQQRYFYIDEKFNIYMADEFSTDGENDKEESNPQKVCVANINNQGSFSIKVIFDPNK